MRSHRLHPEGNRDYAPLRRLVILSMALIATIGLAVNTLEIVSEVQTIKVLPNDYNPYQALYDEMLYPTVRIESNDGVGSGVIINLDCIDRVNATPITTSGHSIFILTAAHVVGNNTSVTVTIYSENVITSIPASVVITDTFKDLALLRVLCGSVVNRAKLAPRNYKPYLFASIWTVGCSLGLNPRPSFGNITNVGANQCVRPSDKGQTLGSAPTDFWEISAPILPGNSGGPVYSADTHEVIGIAVWVKVYHGQLVTTMAGIVPIQTVYQFLESIKFIELPNSTNSINSMNSINSKLKERR
jgi:S1-C subfamily serine protease